jgi:hypothetical protein
VSLIEEGARPPKRLEADVENETLKGDSRAQAGVGESLSEFLCKRGHEIMLKGMFHDQCNDYQKNQKTESTTAVSSRTD